MFCRFSMMLFSIALVAVCPGAVNVANADGLTAEQVVRKMIDHAQGIQSANKQANYSYTKVSTTEEFNGKGQLKEKKEKLLQFESGYGRLSQLKLNGRSLTGSEFRKQEQEAIEARQHVTDSKGSRRDDNWEKYITPELVGKYQFTMLGHESVNGRDAYMIGFEPRSGNLPVNHLVDRLINRLGGKIWVDEEDFEIARAQVALR